MNLQALQKIVALLGEGGGRLGAHALEVGADAGRMANTGGKWFAGRHPKTAAAALGGAGAMGIESLLGDDDEDERARLLEMLRG